MTLHWYRCWGGKRTLDIHHGGRVVFSFHFWPWLVGKRWKIERWGTDCRFLEVGPFEFVLPPRPRAR